MAEGRGKERWSHTAAILALIANVNRDPKKTKPFEPSDFHPYGRSIRRPVVQTSDLSILKRVFVDPHHPKHGGSKS